jgi:hypothetical protein
MACMSLHSKVSKLKPLALPAAKLASTYLLYIFPKTHLQKLSQGEGSVQLTSLYQQV